MVWDVILLLFTFYPFGIVIEMTLSYLYFAYE